MRRRLANASTSTAESSTSPVMTNFVPEARPSRPMPFSIEAITSAPSRAETTRPMPPKRLVPPMTAAAMTGSSRFPPPAPVATERAGRRA